MLGVMARTHSDHFPVQILESVKRGYVRKEFSPCAQLACLRVKDQGFPFPHPPFVGVHEIGQHRMKGQNLTDPRPHSHASCSHMGIADNTPQSSCWTSSHQEYMRVQGSH